MTYQTYVTNIPASGNNPSDDQPDMEVNTNSIPLLIGEDHHQFNDPLGGYHLIVHQDPNPLGPGPITWDQATRTPSQAITNIVSPPINQLVTMLVATQTAATSTDTQLFNYTANGGWSQLTGALTGTSPSDGYCWAGGILIQWGVKVGLTPFTDGTVTFINRVSGAIAFPQQCFVVMATPVYTTTSSSSNFCTVAIDTASINKNSFNWSFNAGSSDYKGFFWVAIGQ
jgi:hypothetical protein